MAGPRAADKARTALEAWIKRSRRYFKEQGWDDFRAISIEIAGSEDIYGPHGKGQAIREVMGKYGVHHNDPKALAFASREMAYLATSGPPAMTGFAAGRARPQPLMRVHSTRVDKESVPVRVILGEQLIIEKVYTSESSHAIQALDYSGALPTSDEVKRVVVELEQLVFARSGDKGDNANIGLILSTPRICAVYRRATNG